MDPFAIIDDNVSNEPTTGKRCRFTDCVRCKQPVMRLNTQGDKIAGDKIYCLLCVRELEGAEVKANDDQVKQGKENFLACFDGEFKD